MVPDEMNTGGSSARDRHLRVFRFGMVIAGTIAGALLPTLNRAMADSRSTEFAAHLGDGWFAIVVHAAYGALAGWAIGALVAHLLGER